METGSIVFYSINTVLAHFINETFYQSHFVWCSPVYAPSKKDSYSKFNRIPPSSSPNIIYNRFIEDVGGEDLHSAYIENNKNGLLKGALVKYNEGIISDIDLVRIQAIIKKATINEFKPLIYVIPYHIIENKIELVDVEIAANPLSTEYIINDLSKNEFDIIEQF